MHCVNDIVPSNIHFVYILYFYTMFFVRFYKRKSLLLTQSQCRRGHLGVNPRKEIIGMIQPSCHTFPLSMLRMILSARNEVKAVSSLSSALGPADSNAIPQGFSFV